MKENPLYMPAKVLLQKLTVIFKEMKEEFQKEDFNINIQKIKSVFHFDPSLKPLLKGQSMEPDTWNNLFTRINDFIENVLGDDYSDA